MAKSAATGLIFAGVAAVGAYLVITNWRSLFPQGGVTPPPAVGVPGGTTPPPSGTTPPPATVTCQPGYQMVNGHCVPISSGSASPPAGGVSGGDLAVLQAIDTNNNGIISDEEMIKANTLWTTNQAPFNKGGSENDRLIQLVTRYWILGTSYL